MNVETEQRRYPKIDELDVRPLQPLSFVVVHFSDDYFHNILKSPCLQNAQNQLVTIDNRAGLTFDTLSSAINAGLEQAHNDLAVVVHEDVLLPANWHSRLQLSLDSLSAVDPDWGMVGSVGWEPNGTARGHWSDPHGYWNTFVDTDFAPVARLDEQILIFRKSTGLRFDDLLPSIHNIGHSVASRLARMERAVYAVNAPTIHKFADENGTRIQRADQSPKIIARWSPPNLAEWRCSDSYLRRHYPEWALSRGNTSEDRCEHSQRADVKPPVVGLGRGGGESHLLIPLLRDLDHFMGWGQRFQPHPQRPSDKRRGTYLADDLPPSGDAEYLSEAVYRAVLSTHQVRADWQRAEVVPRLRAAANRMLAMHDPVAHWGFKMPEHLLIMLQLEQAFPGAKYVHLVEDPLRICLRSIHANASLDNVVGRVAVRAAYQYFGHPLERVLTDLDVVHMAFTTRHQIEIAREFAEAHLGERYMEVRLEDLLEQPGAERERVALWLNSKPAAASLEDAINARCEPDCAAAHDQRTIDQVAEVLAPLRRALRYA